jgi:hypothetical protein
MKDKMGRKARFSKRDNGRYSPGPSAGSGPLRDQRGSCPSGWKNYGATLRVSGAALGTWIRAGGVTGAEPL